MISKDTLLKAITLYRELDGEQLIVDSTLKIRQGEYEYRFVADSVKYIGDGSEFLALSFANEWANHGDARLAEDTLTLDGASWLSTTALELGGQDFQISGRVLESAEDMLVRRKIFELYTSADLNISLYSSGAGKNLDLLVNCGGVFDSYSEPAILERSYNFAVKWQQSSRSLSLTVDGNLIYSLAIAGLSERKTFEQVLVGSSVLHGGANWRGTISDFKIYDGFCEV